MSDLSITNTDSDYYYFTLRPLPSITTDHRPVPPTPPHRMRRSLDHSKTPPPSSTLTHKRTHRRSISLGPLPHTHPLSFVPRSSVSSGGGGGAWSDLVIPHATEDLRVGITRLVGRPPGQWQSEVTSHCLY